MMQSRDEIIKEINNQKWNQYLDCFVESKNVDSISRFSSSGSCKSVYEEVCEISDCFVLTKYVMIEKVNAIKFSFTGTDKNYRQWRNINFSQQTYKIISKIGEDGIIRKYAMTEKKYLDSYDSNFERLLDLSKTNAFYDGNDLEQVIKYYSNFGILY